MVTPMTKDQVAAVWANYTDAMAVVSQTSRGTVSALNRITSASPLAGSSEAERSTWRDIAVDVTAHAVASQRLAACAADLARMILNETAVAEAFEQACNNSRMN